MHTFILRHSRLGIFLLFGIMMISATPASAQGLFDEPELVIYGGTPANQGNFTLGGWGAGICRESTQTTLAGSRSIEITPRGLYQGGRIDFATPQDLTAFFNDRDMYLQLAIRFRGVQPVQTDWMMGFPQVGATDIYGGAPRTGTPVRRVQIILYFAGGQSTECQVEVSAFSLSDDGWMNVSFPFAALKYNLDLTEYRLTRMVITGNGTEPFNVGEIRVIRDATPLQAHAGEAKETGRNYPVMFHGRAQAGASAVSYSWDFDSRDGIQEEAVGDLVTRQFTRAGDFVVTLTVSDIFGIKEPATSTVNVRIYD